ncbi:iron complex outermembrane recepter protein [Sphingomonas gellani]|uniref:Iron complex outermembrane recepter protein n=1 Tax=Sphingomonas gellani TaxID=1166340 RepID=A0A1H8CYB0_9SPHN|nr:TonB-dependent receptor [Sphingomonas gellani]SEM99950.1 iron complex outermembrane recepter protein [Sphingomonas gellani]
MLRLSRARLRLLAGAAVLIAPGVAAAAPANGSPAAANAPAVNAAATTADPAAASDPKDPTADQQAQAESGLNDVVVTATRRETNLQKTPIAINVLGAETIRERHVQSLLDLADGAVPSLRVATFEARQTALTVGIRGIVPLDANQPAREQGVGIYIDGVYLGRQHGLNAALFDVDRIEVLKGPQGTLFGRNTEGGALSIVTKAPSGKFDLRATAGVANYGGYNADLHIDLPEVNNISLKFDGVVQYQDPTTKNPLAGQKGWNYFDRRGGRVAVRWAPRDDFKADYAFDFGYDANSPFYSQLLNYNPNGCVAGAASASAGCVLPGTSPTSFTGTVKPLPGIVQVNGDDRMKTADIGVPQNPSIDKTHGTSLHLTYNPADWIELRSITAYRTVSSTQWDNSGGAHRVPVYAPNGLFSRYSLADLYQHQFSQEFQAVGSLPQIDYAAGLYYFTETANDDAATPSSNQWNANGTAYTIVDPLRGSNGFGSQPGFRSIDRASRAKSKSYAAYGQLTFTPDGFDALHLTAGGRYTHDDKSGTLFIVNNAPSRCPVAQNPAPLCTFSEKNDRFDPMATVAFDASADVHLYAKYASGYRAGGASSRSISYRSFGPETVNSYEVGAKTEFLDHRVRLNLAGYIMDRKNSQVDFSNVAPLGNGTTRNTLETINAPGTTRIRGVEADLTVNPVQGLTLTGSYAYTYTRIPPVLNPFTNVQQNVFIVYTPRNAASGSIDYSLPVAGASLRFHLDGNYAQATQTFDQYATKNDSSFIVNGRVALADIDLNDGRMLTISLWARNLFNEAHVYRRDPSNSLGALTTSGASSINNILGDYGNFNAPRTFGVEGSIRM